MQLVHFGQVSTPRLDNDLRQQRHPILVALASTHHELPRRIINVFDAQRGALHQSQATSVEQRSHEVPDARQLAEHGLHLLVIDYIQLMQGRGRFESRQQELASISRSLKGLAKELNVPIVALSQLSRAPETRSDHRPQLSDLRESGALEQDADVVMFIFREEQYRDADGQPNQEAEGTAEIIVGKQRNGPTGVVKLAFIKEHTRFENLAHGA